MTTKKAVQFRHDVFEPPTGDQMRKALGDALEALLFQVDHLAFDHSEYCAHEGGLSQQAGAVGTALEAALVLVKMHDGLNHDEDEEAAEQDSKQLQA